MYAVSNRYKEVIYSQDARHKLKIWFNNVDYETITNGEQDADDICEKMTVKSRIIPFGSKIFMLENFISKEVELILHDIDISIIENPIKISLGTLVDNDYEYVPIGIFNLQDKPTSDKGKTTITLRDNSVKFDFKYNAQPLIEQHGGSATKLQILQDICEQAGVTCNITDFLGKEDNIGIYDNTKTGRQYVSYIAGQSGALPTINRNGELIFVYVNDLTTVEIPMWYVESYTNGDKFKISRVVYESGIIKYEKGTDTYDTLFLDANNPYVSSETQVQNILNIVNNFEINSFSTGKILGNPAIDSYDLISIYDEDTDTTYVTFACNELVYNGVCIQKFDSEIGLEARQENVSLNGDSEIKRWATTQIDNLQAQVLISTGKVDSLSVKTDEQIQQIQQNFNNYTPINDTVELERSVQQLQTDTYTKIEVDTKLVDGSVQVVNTSTGFIFDETGLNIEKTNEPTASRLNEAGLEVEDRTGANSNTQFYSGYVNDKMATKTNVLSDYKGQTVTYSKNMIFERYLATTNARIENVNDSTYGNGIGIFIL